MLEIKNVSVRYASLLALDRVSFTLEPGQWLMLAGPNGAGKSTVVEAIAQGVRYTGDIMFIGEDIRRMSAQKRARAIGVLSQKNQINYAYTVEEVVGLGRYAHRRGFLSKGYAEDTELTEIALEITGLQAYRHTSVLQLSGGELQRVFLAQVFAQNPTVLILDEPVNHLDLIYQKHIFSLIGDWLKEGKRGVISVVHDLSLAKKYGTHAVLRDKGRVAAEGEVKTCLSRGKLEAVYGMDVYGWMRDMLSQWTEQ